jgi:hypothetical protein
MTSLSFPLSSLPYLREVIARCDRLENRLKRFRRRKQTERAHFVILTNDRVMITFYVECGDLQFVNLC